MRTAPALLVVLALSVALTGCVPDDDPIVVDPEPSASPIFESDEEALAAAEEAYGIYVQLSDQILVEGGVDPERVSPLVSAQLLDELLEGFQLYSDNGWRTSGPSTYDSFQLQQLDQPSDGPASVVVYLCADLSSVRLLDATGADVTPPSRKDRLPLEVEIDFESPQTGLIARSELWSGEDFCA